jgi:hypothetical protein
MNVASKVGAYGATADPARARPRRGAASDFGLEAGTTRAGGERAAATPSAPARSAHAQRSAAQLALLEAQAQASPALERVPVALRARAAAFVPASRSATLDAATSTLDRLRDRRETRPAGAPPSDAERQNATAAYRRTIELPR